MSGETDLQTLIRSLHPELNQGEYIFCVFESMQAALKFNPVFTFIENEGVTAILSKAQADQNSIPYKMTFAWITLTVHSSLEAVGLTAAVARALTAENISCNVVAAFYHDHIFVPHRDAARAVQALERLANSE
jgi:hypothetical protein